MGHAVIANIGPSKKKIVFPVTRPIQCQDPRLMFILLALQPIFLEQEQGKGERVQGKGEREQGKGERQQPP